jgi:Family of unknown function (DUF6077)
LRACYAVSARGPERRRPREASGPLSGTEVVKRGHQAGATARARGLEHEHPHQAPGSGGRAASASDLLLDLVVVALAVWTVLYHVFLVLRLPAALAAAAWGVGTVACSWFAVRSRASVPAEAPAADREPALTRTRVILIALNVTAGLTAAALFAFASVSWTVVWVIWIMAAGFALAAIGLRRDRNPPPQAAAQPSAPRWLEPAVVAGWALALAVLSLFLLEPDGDDAYYVHLSAWVADHGSFPIRDVLYSSEKFPALYYPPIPSWEALVGTLGHLASLQVQDVFYYALPPVATGLSVLAFWRLLRSWRVAIPVLALSVTLTFLLLASAEHRMLGAFFLGRIWQGKVIFLTTIVPVLFALFHDYAERPSRRGLLMLAAAGAAAAGLTTTSMFVVPVIAAGCMATLLPSAPWTAIRGFAAGAGYPLGAAAVTLALGGRTPETYETHDVVAGKLIHFSLGFDLVAMIAVAAVLVGPVLLGRRTAGPMAAAAALLVALLFAPPVPGWILDLTGLGRVIWRVAWALPVAALVGACATWLVSTRLPAAVRALPAVALVAALVLGGHPIWKLEGVAVSSHPVWKLDHGAVATSIVDHARPGAVVLAPQNLSQEIMKATGAVSAVSARDFYTDALSNVPAAHVPERKLLQRFADAGLDPPGGPQLRRGAVRDALQTVRVDIACVPVGNAGSVRLLRRARFRGEFEVVGLSCLRGPRAPS